jgi:hypothetical protein
MKQTKKMQRLLERMAKIERMERGKLCRMGGSPHYNHQTWRDGRNVVRYVPANETEFLKQAIDGYHQFVKLAEQYADEVVKQTRKERKRVYPKQAKPNKPNAPHNDQKAQDRKTDS